MRRSFATLFFAASLANAAPAAIEHMEPPFWWTGMQHKGLQLMVHGKDIGRMRAAIDYPGVRLVSTTQVPNTNYLFVDLEIGPDAKPGQFDIVFTGAGRSERFPYRLLAREQGSAQRQGFGPHDAIYQIMRSTNR